MAASTYLTLQQGTDPASVLRVLHGIGRNKLSIAPIAAGVDPLLTVINVGAPLQMGPVVFGRYPTRLGPDGPVSDADKAE